MAEKVKGKKAKTLSKKSGPRIKKPGIDDMDRPIPSAVSKKMGRTKLSSREKDGKSVEEASAELVASLVEAALPPLEQKFISTPEVNHEASPLILPKANNSKTEVESEVLHIKLSRSLIRKIKEQAADEGISMEEFVTELLAEGVVLRAWEIVERKNQMKGSGGGPSMGSRGNGNNVAGSNSGANNNNNNNRGGNRGKGQRGMNPMRYQAIMEDKASFLEYVRSQERKGR